MDMLEADYTPSWRIEDPGFGLTGCYYARTALSGRGMDDLNSIRTEIGIDEAFFSAIRAWSRKRPVNISGTPKRCFTFYATCSRFRNELFSLSIVAD
jgi:hypothetical protein